MNEQSDPRLQRATVLQTLSYILFALALVVLASESFVERDERVTQGVLLLACWTILLVSAILRFRADHHRELAAAESDPHSPNAVASERFLQLRGRSKKLQWMAAGSFGIALAGSASKLFVPLEYLGIHTAIEAGTFIAFFAGMMVGVVSRHFRRLSEL